MSLTLAWLWRGRPDFLSMSTTIPSGLLGKYTPTSTIILAISSSILAYLSFRIRVTRGATSTCLFLWFGFFNERFQFPRDGRNFPKEIEFPVVESSGLPRKRGYNSRRHSIKSRFQIVLLPNGMNGFCVHVWKGGVEDY